MSPMNPRLLRPTRKAPSGPTDPLFAQVALLLHMDGANNSTNFIDSSSNSHTVTAFGDAKITTAQSKFGGASGAFDNSGDYLEVDAAIGFGSSQDFTVECWARFGSIDDYQPLAMQAGGWIFYTSGNTLYWGKPTVSNDLFYEWNQSVGVWYHLAACRAGETLRLFIDGQEVASAENTDSYAGGSSIVTVGKYIGVNEYYDENIDDLRITLAARYTANFTPPSAPFPNS